MSALPPKADAGKVVVVCRLLIWGGSKNAGAIDNLVIGNSPEYLREELQNMIENYIRDFAAFARILRSAECLVHDFLGQRGVLVVEFIRLLVKGG